MNKPKKFISTTMSDIQHFKKTKLSHDFVVAVIYYQSTIPTFLILRSGNKQCQAGTRTRPATRYFLPYPTRFSFRNHRVAGNPKFWVPPHISGINRKRKTIPSSGTLLWEPQKDPRVQKKCKICHFNVKYDCGTPFGWIIIVQDL